MVGRRNTIEDILSRCEKTTDGCWVWMGSKSPNGYGYVSWQDKMTLVHRLIYEERVWPVGEGLQLDHLCRNRACCNPMHLEEVSQQENIRRGMGGQVNREKIHCPYGHPYDAENTHHYKGDRWCRECSRRRGREYMRKRRAKAKEQS